MTTHTVSAVRAELRSQQEGYKILHDKLRNEQMQAKQASTAAIKEMNPLLAGFLMREVPDLTAPALAVFGALMAVHTPKLRQPHQLAAERQQQDEAASKQLRELIAIHGQPDKIKADIAASRETAFQVHRKNAEADILVREKNSLLRSFDKAADVVARTSGETLQPDHLPRYRKEGNWLAHVWRSWTDNNYKLLMPTAEYYAEQGVNVAAEVQARTAASEEADRQLALASNTSAARTRSEQALIRMQTAMGEKRTSAQILTEVREHITNSISGSPALFNAVQERFGERFPAEARPLMHKSMMMLRLAAGITPHTDETKQVLDNLEGPIAKLDKAARNGRGNSKLGYDLTGKRKQMH